MELNTLLSPLLLANTNTIPILMIGLVAFLIVATLIGAGLAKKKRREATAALAAEQGWDFDPRADGINRLTEERFALLKRGGKRRFSDAMLGQIEDIGFALFTHTYTVSSGKNSNTYRTTVAAFDVPGLALPKFVCKPEHAFHRLGEKLFGMKDIDFDDAPEFSRSFKLSGPDEAAIRSRFTTGMLDCLQRQSRWTVEADGDRFVVYQQHKRLKVAELKPFLDEAMGLLLELQAAPGANDYAQVA